MAKKKLPPPLSEGQLEVMEVVWDRGEVSVTEVWNALKDRREIARNTVQTIMLRLDERGWLEHQEVGKHFTFRAAHPRQSSRRQLVQRLVDTAFNGSTDGLVLALLQERGVSDEEAERIRGLIADAEQQAKKSPSKRSTKPKSKPRKK